MQNSNNIVFHSNVHGEEASEDYQVKINGNPLFVYRARVSACPYNQWWKGYQRPLDQTELASFAYWDMSEAVTVEITSNRPVEEVVVKPSSYGIKPEVSGDRIIIKLSSPRHFVVEVNGLKHTLHLFANPVEEPAIDKNDPKVKYFGPGIHEAGKIEMKSGETIFIDTGAVVHATIEANDASGIKILGRGIIDSSSFQRTELWDMKGTMAFSKCSDVEINGIIIRDSKGFGVTPSVCKNVNISNIKLIGFWRYNSDGIDIANSQHVKIEKCFIRSFDDSIVIKGLRNWPYNELDSITDHENVHDIYVNDCVVWNDWGGALEIGAETQAVEMSGITFKNCDIIHASIAVLRIQHSDRATVKDIHYENINIEYDECSMQPTIQNSIDEKYVANYDNCPKLFALTVGKLYFSRDEERGRLSNVYAKNIFVQSKRIPPSEIFGYDELHTVENVTFENLCINDNKVNSEEEGGFEIGNFTNNIKFI